MPFAPDIAARRFGYGLSPEVAAPSSAAGMLEALRGPDAMAAQFPLGSYHDLQQQQVLYRRFRQHARKAAGTSEGEASDAKWQAIRVQTRDAYARHYVQVLHRRVNTGDGFRERLVAFWGDHFTAFGKNGVMHSAAPLYLEEAVRPHVTGRFADLMRAAVLHPVMIHYLDQESSVGPNSRWARRRRNGRGLNENLAREVLELHSIGVGGPYTQKDVRALANLLTGIGRTRDYSFRYAPMVAEPGGQTVMGRAYPAKISMQRIKNVLDDLATHPATAAHIARKLAVHFVSDDPPQALVETLREVFIATDGDLMQVYAALLDHPEAWAGPAQNMRPPDEFVAAALRGLGMTQADGDRLTPKQIRRFFLRPLKQMGQLWLRPDGPDGAAEEDAAWVTPQGIAARLEWAMGAPKRLMPDLPDPKAAATQILGAQVPSKVAFALHAAESRTDAIGLILMAPAFQRR